MYASRGHCISLPQPMNIATQLPLLSEEVNLVILKRPGYNGKMKHYFVKRSSVQEALEGLCYGYPHGGIDIATDLCKELYDGPDHIQISLNRKYFQYIPNGWYKDVEIMYDRLNNLPAESTMWCGVKIIERSDVKESDSNTLNPEDENLDLTHTGIVRPLEPTDDDDNIKDLLKKIAKGDDKVVDELLQQGKGIAQANWNRINAEPLRELSTPGFFAQAFPTIFISGSCDITVPKLTNIEYHDWIEHIYYNRDNRVSAHPSLKFFLLNLRLRIQALNQGSFLVSQQLNDAHLTIPELRAKLNNDDDTSVPRKIISIAKNFVNTGPYWKDKKKELDALTVFHKEEFGNVVAYFDTNSCAEFHWVPLHELLVKYHIQITGEDEQNVRYKFANDSTFRYTVIMKNNHIVTHYFDTRLLNYMCSVGIELFDFNDYWFRYEFAAGRGMIHSHAVIFSPSHANKIKATSDVFSDSQDNVTQADELEKVLQTTDYNSDTFFSPEFVSMHPAGGKCVTMSNSNDDDEWIPQKTKWAAPEGTAEAPSDNPLAKNIECVLGLQNGITNLHIDLCNKIGLHTCCKYCLRWAKKRKDGKSDGIKECRFHFGRYNKETKTSSGKDIHPFSPMVTKGEHPRYEGRSDHPRFLQHVKARLLSWKANCDTQPIIEQFLLALQNYLTQYACKGTASTEDFLQVYRLLIDDTDDSASVKNLCQRLLLKIVGFVDVSEAAADFINTKGRLVRCTRNFSFVGLSGYRAVNVAAVEGSTGDNNTNFTKDNVVDRFLSVNRREEYPDITLCDWAKICQGKYCKCKRLHVPVFTGAQIYPTWPPNEEFSKAALMRYSKGIWNCVDDLKNGCVSFLESFANFLDSDDCPSHLKDMLDEAKARYDKKHEKHHHSNLQNQNHVSDSQSQSQESWMSSQSSCTYTRLNYRDLIFNDITQDDFADPNLDLPLNTGGPDFDWCLYYQNCIGNVNIPDNGESWIDETSEKARESFFEYNEQLTLPDVNILLANKFQMVAISMIIRQLLSVARGEDPEQLLMLLVGTAGTGKTYVVKAISRIARRLFGRNGAVLNLAPTGAASVLLPDGRTMHSITSIPNKKTKDMIDIQMTDLKMTNNQLTDLRRYTGTQDDRKVMLLNKDERSQYRHADIAWSSQRMKDAVIDDRPYGGIPVVVLSGDNGQLGPVKGTDLHINPEDESRKKHKISTPAQKVGYILYRSFENVVCLMETMRQGPDQIPLLETLLRIRSGEITQGDWMAMNARYEGDLSPQEQNNFHHDRVMTLCETWKEVDMENHNKLRALNVPVAVVPALNEGYHTKGVNANQAVGQIPARALIAVGARVILTKNQKGLTAHKLNNTAMGRIVAINYEENTSPPSMPKYVLVDFPNYTGPAFCDEQPTWIPIRPDEGRCESNCCKRTGLPLMPGYSMPIAKAQGSTIGANQMVTHMRLKLQKSSNFENLAPGTTYIGLSRVDKNSSWALVEKIDWPRLNIINNHTIINKRRIEDKRLRLLHDETVCRNNITKAEFIDLLYNVDIFCNDSFNDAVCDHQNADCICIACTAHEE